MSTQKSRTKRRRSRRFKRLMAQIDAGILRTQEKQEARLTRRAKLARAS